MRLFSSSSLRGLFVTLILPLLLISSGCSENRADTNSGTDPSGSDSNIENTRIADNMSPLWITGLEETLVQGRPALSLNFSAPLDPFSSYQSWITIDDITDTKKSSPDLNPVLSEQGDSLYFTGVRAQRTYRVIVKPGITARNGQRLKLIRRFEHTVKQLPAAASFSGKGKIIPAGSEAGLPVRSVNIDSIEVDYFKVPVENFDKLLRNFSTANKQGMYDINSMIAGAPLAFSAHYDLPNSANKQVETKLPLSSVITENSGIYVAIIKRPGAYEYTSSATYFSVSDIGVHLRQYQNQWTVFTSELTSGEASGGVDIRLLDNKGSLIRRATSDAQGMLTLPIEKKTDPSLLLAIKGKQLAVLRLNGPALDISEFELPQRGYKAREYFIYGPRDVYRPGEKIEFNVLLRNFDGQTLAPLPIIARLRSPNGVTINEQTLSPRQGGLYQYQYSLQNSAATGSWSLQIALDHNDSSKTSKSFLVEDFMPERIRLRFSESDKALLSKTQLQKLRIQGEYLYGAPAAGNDTSTDLRVSPARKPLSAFPDFEFGAQNTPGSIQRFSLQNQKLDDLGFATLSLRDNILSALFDIPGPVRLQYNSSIYESGGRPVQRKLDVVTWQGGNWPGIKPEFDTLDNNLVGGKAVFSLIEANQETLLADRDLAVELIKLKRTSYWEYSGDDGWRYQYTESDLAAQHFDATTQNQPVRINLPVERGYYRLRVTTSSGNVSSLRFRIGQDWWDYGNREADVRPDKISMSLNQPAYLPGDTIRVQLQAPRPGSGFVLVETSEGVLFSKRISLGKQPDTIEIEFPENDTSWLRHDLRIVSMIVQPEQQAKYGVPMRSLGILALPLNRDNRKIELDIDAPESVEPLSRLKLRLRSDQINENMMITVAAVDQGVLSVTDFETPDPYRFFYEARRANVDARDNFADVLHVTDLAFARQRSGGDAEQISHGGERPESKQLIVSLFKGPIEFDANGNAEVEFDMPDFNGAVRIMVAAYAEDRFGSVDTDVLVKAPVVTQLSLPRFAAYGDQTEFTLDIQNTLQATQNLTLDWTLSGAVLYQPGQKSMRISLAKDQKQVIRLPVIITRTTGASDIKLRVSGEDINFTRQWSLGLRPAYPAQTYQKREYLEPGERALPDRQWLRGKLENANQLQISLSSTPPFNSSEQFRSLLAYPYGCLEQTTSRARPLSVADKQIQSRLGLVLPENLNRTEAVQKAINRLQTMQRQEGGFGLWDAQSPEERWLTPYVTEFLLGAVEQGFDVPTSMLDRAIKRLQFYVSDRRLAVTRSRYYGDESHYRFAYRSYAAYVLATQAKAPLGTLRQWFNDYANESKSPLPLVHLAIALKLQGDGERAAKAMQLAASIKRPDDLYLGDYGSVIRDNAIMLTLSIKYQLALPDANQRILSLSEQIYRALYLSTQERDAILQLALALQNDDPQNPWSASLNQAAQSHDIESDGRWSTLIKGRDTAETSVDVTGTSKLFVSQTLVAYPQEAPPKSFQGFSIERRWYDANGNEISSSRFETGDFVIVRLWVTADQRTPDALIVDLLPAGFELENPGLKYSTPLSSFLIEGKQVPAVDGRYSQINNQEYRDDRFVTAADLRKGSTVALSYVMRAVTPGRYQVPSSFVEDMYRPQYRAVGVPSDGLTIEARNAQP